MRVSREVRRPRESHQEKRTVVRSVHGRAPAGAAGVVAAALRAGLVAAQRGLPARVAAERALAAAPRAGGAADDGVGVVVARLAGVRASVSTLALALTLTLSLSRGRTWP